MEVIEIDPSPHDLLKLCERVASFRQPGLVRRQVAGDDVWTYVLPGLGWRHGWTEVLAPTQIDGRIGLLWLAEVGVSSCSVVEVWRPAAGVATIAVAHSVDDIAAQSHQIPVSSSEIQRDGGYLEADVDL